MKPLTLLCHTYNEELLIRSFLLQHRRLFDHGVLLDFASTDATVAIWQELCPDWEVRQSRLDSFDAQGLDLEVMDIECAYPGWKMALNVTEVLLHHDLKGYLELFEERYPEAEAVAMSSVVMCDTPDNKTPLTDKDLFLQRTHGFIDKHCVARPWRYLHKGIHGHYNQVGRHSTALPSVHDPELLLLWWGWSPWPEVKARKLQIQTRIPLSNRQVGWGHQHLVTEAQLEERFLSTVPWSGDLMDVPHYRDTVARIRERFLL